MFAIGNNLPHKTKMILPNGLGDASVVNPPSVSDIWAYSGKAITSIMPDWWNNWSWTQPGSITAQLQQRQDLVANRTSPNFNPPIAPQTQGQMDIWNPDLLASQTQFVANQYAAGLQSAQGANVNVGADQPGIYWADMAKWAAFGLLALAALKAMK